MIWIHVIEIDEGFIGDRRRWRGYPGSLLSVDDQGLMKSQAAR